MKWRKPGGQKGCKGTLFRSDRLDHVVNHFPSSCSHCGHTLDEGMSARVETRQVQDLPTPSPLVVVDHIVHCRACSHCQLEIGAPFPGGVTAPVQYGPNLTALVARTSGCQLIPVKRLAGTFSDVFGVKPSEGTIVDMASPMAGGFRGPGEHVGKALVRARIIHMDETGLRTGGRLHWLHVVCTRFLTHFGIGRGVW